MLAAELLQKKVSQLQSSWQQLLPQLEHTRISAADAAERVLSSTFSVCGPQQHITRVAADAALLQNDMARVADAD